MLAVLPRDALKACHAVTPSPLSPESVHDQSNRVRSLDETMTVPASVPSVRVWSTCHRKPFLRSNTVVKLPLSSGGVALRATSATSNRP